MPQITLRDISIRFRGPALLDEVSCQIDAGEQIGLLGRNGAGKTTLMRLLTGELEPDSGTVELATGTKVALLPQGIPRDLQGTVKQIVAAALPPTPLEEAWHNEHLVKQVLTRMELDGSVDFCVLSTGLKRRVLLARSLVIQPEVLLLDEPTNHLDIDSITWLEGFFANWGGTLIFVTHDRVFLRKLARRILEIDRGKLFDWSCDYETFLQRKEAALEAEEKQNALFDKRLAEEEAWIRQGIKARRTRNEGRVAALKQMRMQRAARRENSSNVRLQIQTAERSGNLVLRAESVSFQYENRPVLHNFTTTILRGDKVGIIGRNGAGKSTLLRILLGQLAPQSGSVKLGTNLQIAYFDQLGEQLREDQSVQDNVADGYDSVTIDGKKQHVIGYLQQFLFNAERSRTPVRFLSGGERNRVMLARMFAKPANLIVLDEPTNDLDTETLELLEARLVEFPGTVLMVSHDREFLNNIVTSTIAFEPDGVREYVGGYDDWLRQRTEANRVQAETSVTPSARQGGRNEAKQEKGNRALVGGKRRLAYKEQQELKQLPARIEGLEQDIQQFHDRMAEPEFYQQGGDAIAQAKADLKALEVELESSYHRWEELEQLQQE